MSKRLKITMPYWYYAIVTTLALYAIYDLSMMAVEVLL
jgi:hypothetical protein